MDQVKEFLEIEVNRATKKILLDAVDKLKNDATGEKEEMTFNIYTVTFLSRNDEVQICNDLLADLPSISMSFEEFRNILMQYKCD